MTLEIGITTSPAVPWMVDYVVEAERLGANSVWLPEYWAHDALTPLGALAQATTSIRAGYCGAARYRSSTPVPGQRQR